MASLQKLRKKRNQVHIAELAAVRETSGLDVSRDAFTTMHRTANATRDWMTLHP